MFKDKKKISYVVLLFFILLFIIILGGSFWCKKQYCYQNNVNYFVKPNERMALGEIYGDNVVIERFVSEFDSISAIEIMFANYNRNNEGHISIQLVRNDSDKVIYTWVLPMESIIDNSVCYLELKNGVEDNNGLKNEKCSIVISSDDAYAGNAITVYSSVKQVKNNSNLQSGNEYIDGDLQFMYWDQNSFVSKKKLRYLICIYIALFIVALELFVKDKNRQ